MSTSYIRIDVELPTLLVLRFLQAIRDLKQEAPDAIHLAITSRGNDESMCEHLDSRAPSNGVLGSFSLAEVTSNVSVDLVMAMAD
jgi:hypothetical protein